MLREKPIVNENVTILNPEKLFPSPEERTGLTELEDMLREPWQYLHDATSVNLFMLKSNRLAPQASFAPISADECEYLTKTLQEHESMIGELVAKDYSPHMEPRSIELQNYFLFFDFLKAVWLFCDLLVDAGKTKKPDQRVSQPAQTQLRQLIKGNFDALQTHARKQQGRIDVHAVERRLRSDTVGEAMDDKFDLEKIAKGICVASHHAWDGVLKVKLQHKN